MSGTEAGETGYFRGLHADRCPDPQSQSCEEALQAHRWGRPASSTYMLHLGAGKPWRLGYEFESKEKLLSIGPHLAVGPADAREVATAAKRLLPAGRDSCGREAPPALGGHD